jgi:hypothetical protein
MTYPAPVPDPATAGSPLLEVPWILWPLRFLVALAIALAIMALIAVAARRLRAKHRRSWWDAEPLRLTEASFPGGIRWKLEQIAAENEKRKVVDKKARMLATRGIQRQEQFAQAVHERLKALERTAARLGNTTPPVDEETK